MEVNPDFRDLLKTFNDWDVKYFVVGAYAVMFYTEPRFTKDLQDLIHAKKNAGRGQDLLDLKRLQAIKKCR